jgi:hypothetical protein
VEPTKPPTKPPILSKIRKQRKTIKSHNPLILQTIIYKSLNRKNLQKTHLLASQAGYGGPIPFARSSFKSIHNSELWLFYFFKNPRAEHVDLPVPPWKGAKTQRQRHCFQTIPIALFIY